MNISESLRICLDKSGMKKKVLAERASITPQTITVLLKSRTCSGVVIENLAAVFDMKASEFIALGELA